ncbi:hypothetical protein OB955_19345 [Halobacteria archaeon AArc-m2/3/4]|uniref:Hpr(Ser) kinase/phosphatase n=1 Tax=Natronoglomus mannanivorans TaxID=2979990 RepID=A0ABT2QIX2_9EURY|nr:hypothetical protein [Halobacteria archaeon AArc-m2/3/4]
MNETCVYEAFDRPIVADDTLSLPLSTRSDFDRPNRTDGYSVIRIRHGTLPDYPDAVAAQLERVYADPSGGFDAYLTDDETIYWFDDVIGTIRVSGGTEIVVSPAESVSISDPVVGRFVSGPGLRTAIGQQGDLVVHASAVVVDGAAIAFTGPSGRGKSTAAAACAAHGHTALADDATVIARSRGAATIVLPGTDRLSISDEVREAVNSPVGAIDSDTVTTDTREREPRPLAAICVLEDGDRFETTRLSSSQATFELMRMSDALYADDDRVALESHTARASWLAETVPVVRFQRPRSLSALDEFVARVEAILP